MVRSMVRKFAAVCEATNGDGDWLVIMQAEMEVDQRQLVLLETRSHLDGQLKQT